MARKRTPFSRPVAVLEMLKRLSVAAGCIEREAQGKRLLARVCDLLGPPGRVHCTEARLADGRLTLTLDSPVWATQVRYRVPDLLAGLDDPGIAEVKVRTRPDSRVEAAAPRQTVLRPPRLSPTAVEHLLTAAEACADPEIGDLFRRLARRRSGAATGGAQGGLEI